MDRLSQKITDGGSAILKFKLSAITGPLLHIAPYAAKMPFKIIKQQIFMYKNYRFKHTCNDDNEIGHRKQQKLDYHIIILYYHLSHVNFLSHHYNVMIC